MLTFSSNTSSLELFCGVINVYSKSRLLEVSLAFVFSCRKISCVIKFAKLSIVSLFADVFRRGLLTEELLASGLLEVVLLVVALRVTPLVAEALLVFCVLLLLISYRHIGQCTLDVNHMFKFSRENMCPHGRICVTKSLGENDSRDIGQTLFNGFLIEEKRTSFVALLISSRVGTERTDWGVVIVILGVFIQVMGSPISE